LGIVGALATVAGAHTVPAEAIVARLNEPASRAATGVERAERDPKVPRLLVVRVGESWYRRPATMREIEAASWWKLWRASVAQGVVSVLDAKTDVPVVRFARGEVAGVAGEPPQPRGTMPRPSR
jgi:hypothetical protein